jgi:predicted dehydrogenase
MNDPLGVCVIGCGYMGRIHAACWTNIPQVAVVAVADIQYERAKRLAERLNCSPYQDFREAVARPDVDVVSVCIPTSLHADASIQAAEKGKHVLCEKPIALSLDDADRMIAAARRNQTKLGIGFMRRHSPVFDELKSLLAAGHFGRPVLYHATDVRELRPKKEMHDAAMNGGPVIDMAVHLFDLWEAIFGETCVSIQAQGLSLAKNRPEISHIRDTAVDTASLLATYRSGDIGSFLVSWGLPPKVNPPSLADRIFGPSGYAEICFGMEKQELIFVSEGGHRETLSTCEENLYQRQINSFAESIRKGTPFPAGAEVGKAALRVALAALTSAQSNQRVDLAEQIKARQGANDGKRN